MKCRSASTQLIVLMFTATLCVSPVRAQSNQSSAQAQGQAQAASKVSAEMVKGKLNPATSKPGDQVTVRMKDDVKSNGQVVLKKGSEITGVVRSVKRADGKAEPKGGASTQSAAQSVMQVEWLTQAGSGAAAQQLNFALQSIAYTNPLYAHQQAEEAGADGGGIAAPRPGPSASRGGTSSGGGLVGGVAGGALGGASSTLGAAGNVGGAVAGGAGALGGQGAASAGAIGQSNAGLLAAPTLIPANSQTATSLQNNFGVSSNQLFMVGHGQAVSTGGTASSMDLFTHMSNDTVITSPSKDFDIGSGAQMDFMVSGKGQK